MKALQSSTHKERLSDVATSDFPAGGFVSLERGALQAAPAGDKANARTSNSNLK
jgi:hypothetical protein